MQSIHESIVLFSSHLSLNSTQGMQIVSSILHDMTIVVAANIR